MTTNQNAMLNTPFGIEIEQTGITRDQAAKVVADFLGGVITNVYDHYDTKKITAPDGRVWKIMSDSSILCQRKVKVRYKAPPASTA